ncbi:MAG: biotin--[acetyl-CoA-carboxylase] ligase [Pyrinomonadaceae bacterium]
MNTRFLYFDSLPSTNTEAAKRAIEGAGEGLCIIAYEQSSGRGRQGRVWYSPCGAGLYFSIILRPEMPLADWPILNLMAAIAVHDLLCDFCVNDLDTKWDIKWPNDVLHRGRKLSGILSDIVGTPRGRACILGIGINIIDAAIPENLRALTTSLMSASGKVFTIEELAGSLAAQLSIWYEKLATVSGTQQIIDAWTARSTYATEKYVRVMMTGVSGEEIIEGVTCGLEADGALRIKLANGLVRIIRSGDVRQLCA